MTEKKEPFNPATHFRNLKGQNYLEVRWRVVWFREEQPEGYISTELVEHDPQAGLAVFKARVGYYTVIGEDQNGYPAYREVYATGYGSETRKDFGDYLEKSETKSIGRALAMLGYGTAQAIELDEGERIVDSAVDRGKQGARPGLAMVHESVDPADLLAKVQGLLAADAEAEGKLPKKATEMDASELSKTLVWLERRARALSS